MYESTEARKCSTVLNAKTHVGLILNISELFVQRLLHSGVLHPPLIPSQNKLFYFAGYFWHITDIHYDPKYAAQGNGAPSKSIRACFHCFHDCYSFAKRRSEE